MWPLLSTQRHLAFWLRREPFTRKQSCMAIPELQSIKKRSMKLHESERKKKRQRTKQPRGDENGDGESLSSEEEEELAVNERMQRMKKLFRLARVPGALQRMARRMVRAKRKAARDSRVAGGKEVNPSASGAQISKTHADPG